MNQDDERRGMLKRLAALAGLVTTIPALAAMRASPILIGIVAIAWLILFFRLQRLSDKYTTASFLERTITLSLALAGYVVGLLIPVDGLEYFPTGLGFSLLLFVAAGLLEMQILRILPSTSAISILNRHRFPFFSLGLALSVVLRAF